MKFSEFLDSLQLQSNSLQELQEEPLASTSTDDLYAILDTGGRPALLKRFKELGVTKLGHRQTLANGLGRLRREGSLTRSPAHKMASQSSAGAATATSAITDTSVTPAEPPPPAQPSPTPQPPSIDERVMRHLRDRSPVAALRLVLAASDDPFVWMLRARVHTQMGSFCEAVLAYSRAASGKDCDDALAELKQLGELVRWLDSPERLYGAFFPKQTPRGLPAPSGSIVTDGSYEGAPIKSSLLAVDPSAARVQIGYRVWCPEKPNPSRPIKGVLLYAHGNGEVAPNYDPFAQLFHLLGFVLIVVEFRGYGWSTATPARHSTIYDDAEPLSRGGAYDEARRSAGIDPSLPTVLFGRSMGSRVAVHLAAICTGTVFAGLIVESGISSLRPGRPGSADAPADMPTVGSAKVELASNSDKIKGVIMPTLILHGEDDSVVPAHHARANYEACGARRKRLVLLPGRGHNDIGQEPDYFKSIANFAEEEIWA
eukprot:CAMPEP_0119344026 /NCGR_PEP_ID=MMETSP1333-20130426/106758_1 /TAXON_ID=418940 /ORGANISM="Scyphosphaera apsteinii, Strain RCC1455" /LENGTH=484 /DNA_ID=CAMNT_0007356449 /DNA_START=140 /DNA_END=1594 /DNA_ORIENTATION=-